MRTTCCRNGNDLLLHNTHRHRHHRVRCKSSLLFRGLQFSSDHHRDVFDVLAKEHMTEPQVEPYNGQHLDDNIFTNDEDSAWVMRAVDGATIDVNIVEDDDVDTESDDDVDTESTESDDDVDTESDDD
ncbi:hypothetical protein F0562_019743 [Nyssa sinensis]|uniref:Uncharacterized protein n=1 Tax=Nyssa sinensis TaxID=561372 RepID=A0A5J5BSY4_9ASTE|nr:hypothetical protein F0562_019743 [Nyssa sinensis]